MTCAAETALAIQVRVRATDKARMSSLAQQSANDDTMASAMARELGALLDAVPGSRRVLQHLAVLERALAEVGLDAIDKLSPPVLERAAAQLAGLPMPQQATALAQLLMALRLTIEDRAQQEREARESRGRAFLSSFLTESKVSVSEASHTDFMRALDTR